MGEVPEEAAKGKADDEYNRAAVSQALEALRLAWGDTYMFGYDERGFRAARPDAPGTGIHRAGEPAELGRLLAGDFETSPA